MALIDLIDMVLDVTSCGADVAPDTGNPKSRFFRLYLYCLAAAFFIVAICVVAHYFGWL